MNMGIENFVVLILSHGRAKNVATYDTIRKHGYSGRVVIVIDNEDSQKDDYILQFGRDNVFVFDKAEEAKRCDTYDNLSERRVILFARNAAFWIAKKLGYRYFIELDDDYVDFEWRYIEDGKAKGKNIKNLDTVWKVMLDFMMATNSQTVAMCQNGDFVGGAGNDMLSNQKLKRKAMNSFICDVENPFEFRGRFNEDVNAYVGLGSVGKLFFSFPMVSLQQMTTQKNAGGMSEAYKDNGTYVKSFYTVMANPSCVRIAYMGSKHKRLHHQIKWDDAVPKILSEEYRKSH